MKDIFIKIDGGKFKYLCSSLSSKNETNAQTIKRLEQARINKTITGEHLKRLTNLYEHGEIRQSLINSSIFTNNNYMFKIKKIY